VNNLSTLHTINHDSVPAYWRVFYTRSRAEKKCANLLCKKNINVFLPIRTVIRQWQDRRKKIDEPLFPNYIFARVDERERIQVLGTQGIVRCVSFGGTLAEVTQIEINQLKLLQSHPELLEMINARHHQIGTDVTIETGPLRGLKGTVVEQRGTARLLVRVSSIDMAVKVELPSSLLRSA
jgi:transcription antitermination factor NusG